MNIHSATGDTLPLAIYFSYSWDDTPHRDAIRQHFSERYQIDIRCDREFRQNRPAQEIVDEIVQNADIVVALLSEKSVDSRWVQEEFIRCDERGIPVIPVKIEAIDKDKLPTFLRNIPTIDYDKRVPTTCIEPLKARVDELRDIRWFRHTTKLLKRSFDHLKMLQPQPAYLQEIATQVASATESELLQLTRARYSQDISIEHSYLTRAIPLFFTARNIWAVSVASVSTFWTDAESAATAVQYTRCQQSKKALRLFVFRDPMQMNEFKEILTVNHRYYGESGAVFVCSQQTYESSFPKLGIRDTVSSATQDFAILDLSEDNSQQHLCLARLDRDFLTIDSIVDKDLRKTVTWIQAFEKLRALRVGEVSDTKILRWCPELSADDSGTQLASAMESLFESVKQSICHLVLFKNLSPHEEARIIPELQAHVGEQAEQAAGITECWLGRLPSTSAISPQHGTWGLLQLRVQQQFTHAFKVTFKSPEYLENYYRSEKHRELRESLYKCLCPDTTPLFDKLRQLLLETPGNHAEIVETWNKIETIVEGKLWRMDYIDAPSFSAIASRRGASFATVDNQM